MIVIKPGLAAALLLLAGCAMPVERRSAIIESPAVMLAAQKGLVDVRTFMPDVSVALKYASSQNITHRPLYPPAMPCLLRAATAIKLKRVQEKLRPLGLAIRIWDAWRPPEVQMELMRQGGGTGMFLDPKVAWSRHCSGLAVDLTLIDLEGREQPMPSAHDENSDRAYFQYSGDDPLVRRNLALLQQIMHDNGFSMIALEWWHFDDNTCWSHPRPEVYAKDIGLALPGGG
ncbi:MAG: peptidase vanX D-ala-D-ala dipeptidase [Verrucomicrobiaceae bacterium]|nr:peptidase vanX D-ala-D-ala dipeptidase [Verrucomicrobiaceae bacterium]